MEQNYAMMSDESLLLLCESSEEALETLIRRHFRMVNACARSLFLVGAEENDLIQEGLIGLLSAIRSYDADSGTPFQTYAKICVKRRMISAVRAANAEKNAPLNDSVSLHTVTIDPHTDETGTDPEATYLGKERMTDLLQTLQPQLSAFEQQVLQYYLEGYSGREIAHALHRPAKSADNAIQRIRSKAAKSFFRR